MEQSAGRVREGDASMLHSESAIDHGLMAWMRGDDITGGPELATHIEELTGVCDGGLTRIVAILLPVAECSDDITRTGSVQQAQPLTGNGYIRRLGKGLGDCHQCLI